MVFVGDIGISKRFYTDVLHQKIEHDFGANIIFKSGISIWEMDPDHVIARELETATKSNRFEIYFETEDIEKIDTHLRDHNVTCFHGVREESWGQRTIRFFDPDGHLIEIGESLPTFVGRMKGTGMTEQEISAKSSIPIEQVKALLRRQEK